MSNRICQACGHKVAPKMSMVEIVENYHKLLLAKADYENYVALAADDATRQHYQKLLDDTIIAIDAAWLDVTGQL